jgi:hypothetical protein
MAASPFPKLSDRELNSEPMTSIILGISRASPELDPGLRDPLRSGLLASEERRDARRLHPVPLFLRRQRPGFGREALAVEFGIDRREPAALLDRPLLLPPFQRLRPSYLSGGRAVPLDLRPDTSHPWGLP